MDITRPSFAPGNWPGWIAAGLLWVLGHLPYRVSIGITASLAPLLRLLMKKRVLIVQRNIKACFPELNQRQQVKMMRRIFRSATIGIAEFAYAWTGSNTRMKNRARVEGVEHLERIDAGERGVILLTCHMSCLEMSGLLVAPYIDTKRLVGVYRPLHNRVIEWLQNRGRLRYSNGTFNKNDIRSAVRHLRNGGFLWYAPDQDFGPEQSEFIPFFGIKTATLTATQKLAQLGRAEVLPLFVRRDEENATYVVQVGPPLTSIPSDDIIADLSLCNRVTEEWIRTAPEQYWWLHRRFKTRPEGDLPFYG